MAFANQSQCLSLFGLNIAARQHVANQLLCELSRKGQDQLTMQRGHCAVHAVFLRTCMSPLIIFAIAYQLCYHCWMGHCQKPELLPTGSWNLKTEETVLPRSHTGSRVQSRWTGKQEIGCYWAPTSGSQPQKSRWLGTSQTQAYQKPLQIKSSKDVQTNKSTKEASKDVPQGKTPNQLYQTQGWCRVETLTNQSLAQQALTLTVHKQRKEQKLARESLKWHPLVTAARQKTKRN